MEQILYYFCTDSQGRWHLLDPQKDVPDDVGNISEIFCTDSEKVKNDLLAVNQKVAPPGIIYILRCTHNTHYQMTWDVLEGEGFRGNSLKILAAGARDVDLYKFALETAHATSSQGKNGRPIGSAEENAQRFINWMKFLEEKFGLFLKDQKFQEALYVLGWMCHGIQDLYVHKGMAPREHIWLQTYGEHPDKNFDSDRCRDWTVKLYRKLKERYKLARYNDNFFSISLAPYKRCAIEGLNSNIWEWGKNLTEMSKFQISVTDERVRKNFVDYVDYIKLMFGKEPHKNENLKPLHNWHKEPGEDWLWNKL